MNNNSRKKGLIVSALVGAFALTCGFSSLPVSAQELSVTVAPSSLFTENAAVETEKDVTGLIVKGNATLKGVCTGETTIEYYLPAAWGGAVFEVCDTDGDLIYSVYKRWRSGTGVNGGGAFVGYNGSYYLYDGTVTTAEEITVEKIGYGALPNPGYMGTDGVGTLKLKPVSNGEIAVDMSYNTKGIIELASFALSQEDAAALSDGYTVNIRGYVKSDPIPTDHPSNVLITKINGVDVTGESVAVAYDSCDIAYSDTYNPEVAVGGKNEITLDKGNALAPFAVLAKNARLGSLQLGTIELAEKLTSTEDFTQKTAGKYDITIGNALATKSYSVRVVDSILHSVSSLVIGDENATVKTAHTQAYDGGDYAGVYVEGTAQLAGTFYGDFEMEYVLPGSSWGIAAIGVCDLNGNEKFYVGRTWKDGGHYVGSGAAYVYDATANKYYTNLSSEIVELTAIAPAKLCRDILPAYNHPEKAGKLYLQWNGDTIIVKADLLGGGTRALAEIPAAELKNGYKIVLRSQSYADKTVFSVFSGSASPFVVGSVNGTSLAGSKAKISYGADILSYDGAIENNVIYLPKDGAFDNFTANTYRLFGADWKEPCSPTGITFTALGNFDIHTAGTYENVAIRPELNNRYGTLKAYDVVVEPSYKVTFDENGGEEIPDWYYSAHTWNKTLPTPVRRYWKFGGWEENGTSFTALPSENQRAISLKAVWIDDVAPIVSLNVDAVVTRQTGEGLGIAKTDVTAIDAVSGALSDTAVTVFVKAPNANDYVDYMTFTFNAELYGAYDIRYVVKDSADNQTVVDRKIYYTATPPTITVNGEVPLVGLTYQTIALPKATAKAGDEALTYTLSVTLDGKQITVTDHTFKPAKAGAYSIIYAATQSGQTASKEFTVIVEEDTQKPVIEVEFTTTRIVLGEKITPPTATATDNVAGSVTVSVEIKSGTTVVSTGEYTPEKVGVYSVVYTASDEAGNTQTLTFEVLVSEQAEDNHDWTDPAPENSGDSSGGAGSNGDSGCGSSVESAFAALGVLFMSAIVCITKNKKQTEKGDK